MKALVVYAHPEPTSFTAALKDTAVQALEGAGHDVTVSDLYAEGFDPVAGRHDFTTVADPDRFHYQAEQLEAATLDGFAEDLRREQQRVGEADLFVFVFPIWWGGVPAILKGWFDRVLAYGFAYRDGRRYETGLFQGRAAVLGMTSGGTRRRFTEGGAYGPIGQVLWPTQHCMVEYLGLATAEPFVAYAAPRVDEAERTAYLQAWAQRVLEVPELVARPGAPLEPAREAAAAAWASPA
jgi:NAD(P)H dehydrogenase (quinone)